MYQKSAFFFFFYDQRVNAISSTPGIYQNKFKTKTAVYVVICESNKFHLTRNFNEYREKV